MKVVIISTNDCEGGAARAAFRLHRGLRAAGVESSMLVSSKTSSLDSVQQVHPVPARDAFFWDLLQMHAVHFNRTPVSNTYFSLCQRGTDVSTHPLVTGADVIHLHWIADFQSCPSLTRLLALGKPVLWTLHDQRPFTGGCHYSAGCDRYKTDCAGCPQLVHDMGLARALLADQLELLAADRITVVALSRWMAACARESRLFARSPIEVVPNGLETDVFVPMDREQARLQLGLPAQECLILFGADYGAEQRKGFHKLQEALDHCMENPAFARQIQEGRIQLISFGQPADGAAGSMSHVRNMGRINDDATMARLYAAANLFVLPSIEDNLPNTVMEAMSCGTAVVAFGVGGVPDMVEEGVTGCLAPPADAKKLAELLAGLVTDPDRLEAMGKAGRRRVEAEFSLARQAGRHLEVYSKLVRRSEGGNPPPAGSLPVAPNITRIFPKVLQSVAEGAARQAAEQNFPHALPAACLARWLRKHPMPDLPHDPLVEILLKATEEGTLQKIWRKLRRFFRRGRR
jgi:glycosyltransferase involved in cell wall biosynthesis